MKETTKKTIRKILTITTTVFWGVPALYVLVGGILMFDHIPNFDYPLGTTILCLVGAVLIILSVIAQWDKNKTRKVLGNVLFLIFSVVLVPIIMLLAAFWGPKAPLIFMLLYPIIGLVLAILSLRFS
jgi:hypothetical protein